MSSKAVETILVGRLEFYGAAVSRVRIRTGKLFVEILGGSRNPRYPVGVVYESIGDGRGAVFFLDKSKEKILAELRFPKNAIIHVKYKDPIEIGGVKK